MQAALTPQASGVSGKRAKVLLSEGSSTSAREALYALGPLYTIDILDPSPLCQGRFSRYVRRWHRCPSYSKDPLEYLRYLVGLLRREKYDVFFPTHEQAYLIARVQELLRPYVGITTPSFAAVDSVQDKAKFAKLCDELAIPQPATKIVRTRTELEEAFHPPQFIKPAHGTAGQGVTLVRQESELRAACDRLAADGLLDGQHDILVQEAVPGPQEDIGVIFRDGRMLTYYGARTLKCGVGGSPMARSSIRRQEAADHIARLGSHLNWSGPIGLGYILDERDDQPKFIDGNPRIGETFHGLLAGVNGPDLCVRIALGEQLQPVPAGKEGVRTYPGMINFISSAIESKSRTEILREAVQQWKRRGIYEQGENGIMRPREDWLSVIPTAAVTALLLAYPAAAERLVAKTVENYSLPGNAAQEIRDLPWDKLVKCCS
jgi:predicted ATP-grasp superfamily ATP-dependent carboligase